MINTKNCKEYCCEDIRKIENYDKAMADTTQVWHCHHRLEVQGQFSNSRELLKRCGMYWNRPANELIFLTDSDHIKLHKMGRPRSEETRKKISESSKDKKRSEETRRKMSEVQRGKRLSEETRRKLSESSNGKKMSEEARRKISESKMGNTNVRGKRWFNDGTKSTMATKCPEGFKPGRIKSTIGIEKGGKQ